ALRFFRFYHRVLGAVKRPNTEGLRRRLFFRIGQQQRDGIAASAYRRDGGEPFGVRQAEAPRAVAAHAQTGQINAARVHVVFLCRFVEQREQHVVVPALAARALRRDDDEREVLALFHQFRRAVHRDVRDVAAAFASAVQEEHERPPLARSRAVILGQVEQILRAQVFADPALERFCLLRLFGFLRHGRKGIQAQHARGANERDESSHTGFPFIAVLVAAVYDRRNLIHPPAVADLSVAVHINFHLGKSCESTNPTGSFRALTTIKSSMFRSLKIFSASTASASSRTATGLRVITFASGCASTLSSAAMRRRRSPSVNTPTSLPRELTTLTLPDLACVIRSNACLTVSDSGATALRGPARMMSPTRSSSARPIAPEGWYLAKSVFLNPRACNTAIASASPSASIAVVLAVGARLNGHASRGTRTLSSTSLCCVRVDFGAPVSAMILTEKRL